MYRPRKCCVPGCANNNKGFTMYRWPEDEELSEMWRQSVGLPRGTHLPPYNMFVCRAHFKKNDIGKRRLKKGAIPICFSNADDEDVALVLKALQDDEITKVSENSKLITPHFADEVYKIVEHNEVAEQEEEKLIDLLIEEDRSRTSIDLRPNANKTEMELDISQERGVGRPRKFEAPHTIGATDHKLSSISYNGSPRKFAVSTGMDHNERGVRGVGSTLQLKRWLVSCGEHCKQGIQCRGCVWIALRLKYREKKEVFLEQNIKVKEPIALFREWMEQALQTEELLEPNAACLATVNKDGKPSNRFVLLKDVTDEGFRFFTNYGSNKAKDIANNPNVAMTLYWLPLRRQIRIEGVAEKIPQTDSLAYFRQRPRASQIGALASEQSTRIPSREYLDDIESGIKAKLGPNGQVPLPNWGGYLIRPHTIEFWQGQTDRLHDRIQFRRGPGVEKEIDETLVHKGENGWVYERLAP
ncbi:uncharacterized protein sgll isoform X1 [Eurosta solidaginis]|uniref:uncharacterized protein sgll isoform X1 n=1 Tax=Eurosta solidaginis TaxID=178769 RepID=UPI0035313BC0